jgi:hypothetical protein
MVLTTFSDATMANLQDDSPDLHIADAPRARTIGIRASARIFDPSRKVTAAKIPAFSNSRPLSAIELRSWPTTELLLLLLYLLMI